MDLTGSLLMAEGFGEEQSEEPRVHSYEILQVSTQFHVNQLLCRQFT